MYCTPKGRKDKKRKSKRKNGWRNPWRWSTWCPKIENGQGTKKKSVVEYMQRKYQ